MSEFIILPKQEFIEILEDILKKRTDHLEVLINSKLKSDNETQEYLTIKETTELLKVSRQTLTDWKKTKILTPHYIGKRVLYNKQEVINRVEKRN
jgi:hypothetical protein